MLLPGGVICDIHRPDAQKEYLPSKLIVCFAEEADQAYIDGVVEVKLSSAGDGLQRVVRKEKAFSFMTFDVDAVVRPTKGLLC